MIINLLSDNERKLFKTIKIKKDKTLFHENDECEGVGIVNNGTLTISSYTFEGREIIYNTLTKGNLFGNNLLFSKDAFYRGNVIAKTDAEIYFIRKTDLIYLLQNNADFLQKYLEINAEFSISLNSKIKLLSFSNAKDRIMYYFFINHNKVLFKNMSSLANNLFLSREATSRIINKMIKDKEIIKSKGYLIKEG